MSSISQILILALLIFSCLTDTDALVCAQCLPNKLKVCDMKTCRTNHKGICTATIIYKGDEAVDRILACRLKTEAKCDLNLYNAIEDERYEVKCCNNHDLCNMDFVVVQGK